MAGTPAQGTHVILTSDIFFVKDRVDKDEIKIEYCPTGDMLADYFTKPLQGSMFNKFRNVIMGYAHVSSLKSNYSSVPDIENKERVEKYAKKDENIKSENVFSNHGSKLNEVSRLTPQTYAEVVRSRSPKKVTFPTKEGMFASSTSS